MPTNLELLLNSYFDEKNHTNVIRNGSNEREALNKQEYYDGSKSYYLDNKRLAASLWTGGKEKETIKENNIIPEEHRGNDYDDEGPNNVCFQNIASCFQMKRLLAILWKNGIIRLFRHKTLLVFLLLLPVLLFVFIAYARSKINAFGKDYINITTYNQQMPANYFLNNFGGDNKLVYTPKTTFTDDLIRRVQLRFQIPNSDVEGLQSEADLIKFYKKNSKDDNYKILGVVFDGVENFPKTLNYQLRTYEKHVDYQTNKLFRQPIQYVNGVGSDEYIEKGLLALQLAIDLEYITLAKLRNRPDGRELPEIMFQEFPYPPYLDDHGFNELFAHILPLATLFSFILICPDLLKRLVEEKSTGIKELMKMMGMGTVFQWLGWFVSSVLISLVSVAIIVFLMKVPMWHDKYAPIEYCSWSIYTTFLLLYCIASISKCFLLSTFFHKPSVVIVFAIFFWLLSYIIPVSISNDETATFFSKMLLMLLPNMCLYYGYKAIAVYELREIGMHWNTIFSVTDGGDNDVKMIHVFIMLAFDVIFYFILALYFDTVNPGPYGIQKPYSFPFTYLMNLFKWKRKCSEVRDSEVRDSDTSSLTDEIEVILEDIGANDSCVGIRVENLRKDYNNVVAVNRLNVKFLKGEITALLGHNGAGKTTTLSIITGIINRTSGRVIINGIDIADDISLARRSMGICTQHNLFFQDLTVEEHFTFFSMVKGRCSWTAKSEAEILLRELQLTEKRNALPMTLSGGMQRKLCLGIALCGNPEILVLDEPTSGMDVQTRRFIWDKLLERRRINPQCTTIVSTHFMEEAEVIGDRIAIMNRGELSCYGTLTFLKNKFDTGYRLKLNYLNPKPPFCEGRDEDEDEVDGIPVSRSNKELRWSCWAELRSNLTELISNYKSVVEVIESNDKFMECKMPLESGDRQTFLEFLEHLERDKEKFNIGTINITNINLEDIFLKHLHTDKPTEKYNDNTAVKTINFQDDETYRSRGTDIESGRRSTNRKETINSGIVLMKKRWYIFNNTLLTTTLQCIPAVLLIVVLMLLMIKSYGNNIVSFKTLKYDLTPYGKTSVYYGGYGSEFNEMLPYYSDIVKQEGSIPIQAESVSNAIVQAGVDNIAFYKRHIVVAAEFNSTTDSPEGSPKVALNVMYSNLALHGAPISLNLITNTLVKWMVGPEYSIKTANFPLPGQKTTSADMVADAQQLVLFILLFPIAIFTFLCTFLSTPWQDLSSRMKHLQHMTGLSEVKYWSCLWIFDLFACAIGFAFIVFFLMGLLFGVTGLVEWIGSPSAMGVLFLILMIYVVAALPLVYIMSHLSTMPAAVNAFLISGLFSGFVPTIIIYVMEVSNDEPYVDAAKYLSIVLSFWPQFGLCYACLKYMLKTLWIYDWNIKTDAAKKILCYYNYNPCCDDSNIYECSRYKNYLIGNDDAFGNTLGYMLLSTGLYFCILIYHKRFINWLRDCFNNCKSKGISDKPSECRSGRELTDSNEKPKMNNLQFDVNKIVKEFDNKKAVNGLSFQVYKKSLFGILGVNGAGKSTTFKVLAGIEKPTGGTAEIFKQSLQEKSFQLKNGSEYTKKLGYCPQENFIVETLTGRQILNLFAGLRGIPMENVANIIKEIGIEQHADKCSAYYSGGTKRKLCLAIAVLGSLPICLLDEPTTGVDPKSKRDIWELLKRIRKDNGCSIVLTSHSMDECEVLSDRLLIMKEGVSKAENTIPRLKEKYGHMYKVVFKISSDVDENYIQDKFAKKMILRNDYTIFDHHGNSYNYHMQKRNVRLSTIFHVMEDLLREESIKEYTVHEPSLEDVFLQIAKPNEEKSMDIEISSA